MDMTIQAQSPPSRLPRAGGRVVITLVLTFLMLATFAISDMGVLAWVILGAAYTIIRYGVEAAQLYARETHSETP